MFDGKMKAVTFSYDDGTVQDVRLIEILNKYGLKATFNLNSEHLGRERRITVDGVEVCHDKIKPEDVRRIYAGHEIASHTLTHPRLPAIDDDAEVIRQVEEDRIKLSELAGARFKERTNLFGTVACEDDGDRNGYYENEYHRL